MTNQYPSSEDLKLDSALSFMTSLRTALETLFVGKDTRRKVAAVGHAIIQAARPRTATSGTCCANPSSVSFKVHCGYSS